MAQCITGSIEEVLEFQKGGNSKIKGACCWNDEDKEQVKKK